MFMAKDKDIMEDSQKAKQNCLAQLKWEIHLKVVSFLLYHIDMTPLSQL